MKDSNGSLWPTAPVSEQSEIELTEWHLIQATKNGRTTVHFVGYVAANFEGRVSSAITDLSINDSVVIGITATGRKYKASGPQGFNGDAEYVLSRWIRLNGFEPENISIIQNSEVCPILLRLNKQSQAQILSGLAKNSVKKIKTRGTP
jgi:hypothetical protein